MAEMTAGAVTEGSYNDARVRRTGGSICVMQNPAMFIVLAVLAGAIGAVLFFLGGSGRMTINGLAIPPAVAGIIGMVLGGVLGGIALLCVIQALHPGTLTLDPGRRQYVRHGGIVGKLLGKGARRGGFDDFAKVRLAHCTNRNPNGLVADYWRLTLCWKDGMEQNLGCIATAEKAGVQAEGFASALGVAVERVEGGS